MSNGIDFIIDPDGEVLRSYINNKKRSAYELSSGRMFEPPYEVAIIQGPVGSGKSRASLEKIFLAAASMYPVRVMRRGRSVGIRQSKWVIIKDTTPALKTTILADFLELFPETTKDNPDGWGELNMTPPITYKMKKGEIEAEFIFLALDDEVQIKKLKSMNLTGGMINEGQFTSLEIFTALCERSARFPNKMVCKRSNPMVIMDMNAASETHWIPIMRGDVPAPDYFTPDMIRQYKKPEWWDFFMQPPALIEIFDSAGNVVDYEENPLAENMKNLPDGYYMSKVAGQSKAIIDMTCMNRTGILMAGKPVFPEWNKQVHQAKSSLIFRPELPLYVGLDFGRTPAAVWAQNYMGRWFVLGDYYLEDVSSEVFAPMLKKEMLKRMPELDWSNVRWWGDPAGEQGGQATEATPIQIFRKLGIKVNPSFEGLRIPVRIEAVKSLLNRMVNGYPSLLVDPSATMIIGGFDGGYRYKKIRSSSGDRYSEDPDKTSRHSHNMDAFMYMICGEGEARMLLRGTTERAKNVNTRTREKLFRKDRGGAWARR